MRTVFTLYNAREARVEIEANFTTGELKLTSPETALNTQEADIFLRLFELAQDWIAKLIPEPAIVDLEEIPYFDLGAEC